MATSNQNLSDYDLSPVEGTERMRVGIAVSEWNIEITSNLLQGAQEALLKMGVLEENIIVRYAPGSFELPLVAEWLIEGAGADGVVALGSVIQGETRHFEFVCNATAQGIMQVGIKHSAPVIFGVLTDNNIDQARARSGGKHGNKGVECAVAAVKMIALKWL
ncbi:MAG: 6,7-dimethyl-8-ribityllumazine synthase [Cryomorphaceae bacterium]|nr:MAG: 6,7-dimethyl-8-ribityllumazine synthase [Cryomorphaceae bacterium]